MSPSVDVAERTIVAIQVGRPGEELVAAVGAGEGGWSSNNLLGRYSTEGRDSEVGASAVHLRIIDVGVMSKIIKVGWSVTGFVESIARNVGLMDTKT